MNIASRLTLLTYKAATAAIAPLGLLYLMHKKRRDPPYGPRKWELLGYTGREFRRCVWFHAVSVGEVIAARPVIAQFAKRHPKLNVIVTTTTTTGAAEAQKIEDITHLYAPLDSPCAVRRFFKAVKPSHLFIMETELWPNLLDEARRHKTNVVLFNARMPEKTCLKYEKHPILVKDLIAKPLSYVICQTDDDKDRFERIGVPEDKIMVANSLKYDLKANEKLFKLGRSFKEYASLPKVLGAMSTHDGEEEQILETFFTLKALIPELKLVIVPRHQSSTKKAVEFLQEVGESYILKSTIDPRIIEALKAVPHSEPEKAARQNTDPVPDPASSHQDQPATSAPEERTALEDQSAEAPAVAALFAYQVSEADKILDEAYQRQKQQRVQRHRQRYAKHLHERDRNPYISPGDPLPRDSRFDSDPYLKSDLMSDPFGAETGIRNAGNAGKPHPASYPPQGTGTPADSVNQAPLTKIKIDPASPPLKGRIPAYAGNESPKAGDGAEANPSTGYSGHPQFTPGPDYPGTPQEGQAPAFSGSPDPAPYAGSYAGAPGEDQAIAGSSPVLSEEGSYAPAGSSADPGLETAEQEQDQQENIVPLTPEEMAVLKELCTKLFAESKTSVLIGDTFGEMEFYLGLCDLVFMGGSFVDIGGHNPLEPAYFALPVITGPYYYNFKEQFEKLIEVQGAYLAPDHKKLFTIIKNLFDDPDAMVRSGVQALDVQEQGRGATKLTLEYMEKTLLR